MIFPGLLLYSPFSLSCKANNISVKALRNLENWFDTNHGQSQNSLSVSPLLVCFKTKNSFSIDQKFSSNTGKAPTAPTLQVSRITAFQGM